MRYELSNHLGNVLAVISDKLIPNATYDPNLLDDRSGTRNFLFTADVVSATDYYAFGMVMPGRTFEVASAYRYGFNGKEKKDGINIDNYDFGARIYDGRVGRWLSVDALAAKHASTSPYVAMNNSPISVLDPDGNDPASAIFEAIISFGIEAGLDFAAQVLIEGKSFDEAFEGVNWKGATYEGAKTLAIAFFTPSGTSTATKIAKVSNSKVGQFTRELVFNLAEEAYKMYLAGDFNDEDGDFSVTKFKDNFDDVFISGLISTFVARGYNDKAKEAFDKLKEVNPKLAKQKEKLIKNIESLNNGKGATNKTVQNRQNKIAKIKQEAKQTAKEAVGAKGATEITRKATEIGASDVKEKSEKKQP